MGISLLADSRSLRLRFAAATACRRRVELIAAAAIAAAVRCAFAATAESVAGDAVPFAGFCCHSPFVWRLAGVPCPAGPGVSGVLYLAGPAACPAVVGISYRPSRLRCLELPFDRASLDRWDEPLDDPRHLRAGLLRPGGPRRRL